MRAQTVQEGSIRSPTFSKPVGPRPRTKRAEGSTNGIIPSDLNLFGCVGAGRSSAAADATPDLMGDA
jgi:hypothetical protein